jgi:hypothetical protein
MLAIVLSWLLVPQDPPAPPKPPEAPAPATAKAVEVWDDKTAKAAVDEFGKLVKGSANMAQKNRALDLLAGGSNKLMVRPLAQLIESEKLVVVRKRAAELLANQPAEDANAAIRRLIANPRVGTHPVVVGELLRGLSRCGYAKNQWKDIDGLFERDYHVERVPIQEAILELVIAHKEQQALPILLRNLDEPAPENVDDASNPPKEYWEARWKSWSAWRGKVKDALFAVTGQRFSTAAEAKAWLKKNPIQ